LLGRVNPQGSLLETRLIRKHLVTKGSFYERLANHGDQIVSDQDYAHLYSAGMGRPSIPPSVMVKAMLCATHDRTSDAETSRRTRVDADWKAAMGVDDDFEGIAATTFSLMRSRMVATEADAKPFEATLARAVETGILRGKLTTIIDTSPVHGAGAVADTYELIRGFLKKTVRAAGPELPATTLEAAGPYLGAKPQIEWQDPTARKDHLARLVKVARQVTDHLGKDSAAAEPAALLAQVVEQDTELDPQGSPAIRQQVARDRVISYSDPEIRHGRKSWSRRFNGHKMDVLTDESSELVLGVEVRAGNAGDGAGACDLVSRANQITGVEVGTVLGDMAYSDGEVREQLEAQGAKVVAKMPPVNNQGRYPKTDFEVDTQAGKVTCPAGQVTSRSKNAKDHKGHPGLEFIFAAETCAACPLRHLCIKPTQTKGRTIFVGRHHDRIAAARRAEHDPQFKVLIRRRAKIERKIDHLQDLGAKKARYRGRRKTRLQILLAAAVANFSRLSTLGAFQLPAQT
jgi:hypothetical protein